MERTDETDRRTRGRRLKIARVIDEYGLDGMGDELERRWTADGEERSSLRDLADDFNVELLTTVLAEDGEQPLDGEVENAYRLLTDDDVSDGDRTRMRRRLERQGIDVDTLLEDFVTYQAVRTYLMEDRDAEYEHERASLEEEAERVRLLRGRISTVTENKLEQLSSREDIALGEFRTIVDVTVICEDCGAQEAVTELLERGGCDCRMPDEP